MGWVRAANVSARVRCCLCIASFVCLSNTSTASAPAAGLGRATVAASSSDTAMWSENAGGV